MKFNYSTALRFAMAVLSLTVQSFQYRHSGSGIAVKTFKSVDISAVEFARFLVIFCMSRNAEMPFSTSVWENHCLQLRFPVYGLDFDTSQAKSRRWVWRVFPTKITLCITRFSVENSPWRDLCQIWCNYCYLGGLI